MKTAICTIKIEVTHPFDDPTRKEWSTLREDLVHYIDRYDGCDIKFFGWIVPSPELTNEDLVLEPGEHD